MAIRYSGGLKINVVYQDRGDYRVVVTEYGPDASHRHPLRQFQGTPKKWVGIVKPPASGFGRGVAYDSPEAYDQTARAALAFAADDEQRGRDSWVEDKASTAGRGWHIGRSEREAWVGY